jgi:cytochrome c1
MWRHISIGLFAVGLLALAGGGAGAYWSAQANAARAKAASLTGGDPARGPELMLRYGCGGCHTVAGVPGAAGQVGPPLTDVGGRVYVGGVLTNTPANLIGWIANPKGANPLTAMPTTGISEAEARHVAAYLYSLRR